VQAAAVLVREQACPLAVDVKARTAIAHVALGIDCAQVAVVDEAVGLQLLVPVVDDGIALQGMDIRAARFRRVGREPDTVIAVGSERGIEAGLSRRWAAPPALIDCIGASGGLLTCPGGYGRRHACRPGIGPGRSRRV